MQEEHAAVGRRSMLQVYMLNSTTRPMSVQIMKKAGPMMRLLRRVSSHRQLEQLEHVTSRSLTRETFP